MTETKAGPVLHTERLTLTPWEATEDMAVALYAYAKHKEVGPAAGWKPHETPRESLDIIKDIFLPTGAFAIRWNETGEIIGSITLEKDSRRQDVESRELGYSLARHFWEKGIMTEAGREVMRYGFEDLGLEIISIAIYPLNERSRSVARKLGFKLEGTLRMACRGYDESLRALMVGSITKEEWEQQKK